MLSLLKNCARCAACLLLAVSLFRAVPVLAHHDDDEAPPRSPAAPALQVRGAWIRAMPPGVAVAAGYLKLRNAGAKELRVVGLRSPLSSGLAIHEMKMAGGQMQMREVKGGLAIPPGQTIELEPNGYHLMFTGVKSDVVPGMIVPVTLALDDGSTLDLKFPVRLAQPEAAHAH